MRSVAQSRSIEVHGSIWVVERLMVSQVIPPSRACDALERLLETNPRVPIFEIEKRLKAWRRMIDP